MTDDERKKASIQQINTYGRSQYPEWRLAAVKSIQKILLHLDDFYADILSELEQENSDEDIVHGQIRNGWFFEAVSQAEQGIEDLFSTMMNLGDMAYFAKNVIRYNASKVKKYIWDFKVDDLQYICDQCHVPYFPLDEPWEHEDVFNGYKESVLLMQKYLKELQEFHRTYYLDYCQYKHGLSVGLTSMANPLKKSDAARRDMLMAKPLEGALQTFHQGTVAQYQKRSGRLPAMGMLLSPATQGHLRELHDEENLLFFTLHPVDIEQIVEITEHACYLLKVLWKNIIWMCEEKETDECRRVAFPTEDANKILEIGFPRK